MIKLHLMCGSQYKEGWINCDLNRSVKADRYFDVTQPFPFEDNSVDLIYSEHGIEHITQEQARVFLSECYRVLKPGGVIRIATPDLRWICKCYLDGNWQHESWLFLPGIPEAKQVTDGAEYLNVGMRAWGHQFLYDEESLKKMMEQAGFKGNARALINKGLCSAYREHLDFLETREDSRLIIEGLKK